MALYLGCSAPTLEAEELTEAAPLCSFPLFWPPALQESTLALTLLDSLRLNDSFKVTRPELSILSSLSWDSVNGQKPSRFFPHLCILSALTAATPPPPQEVALASHLSWLPGPPHVSVMSTEHI